jgi:hypothetical protein
MRIPSSFSKVFPATISFAAPTTERKSFAACNGQTAIRKNKTGETSLIKRIILTGLARQRLPSSKIYACISLAFQWWQAK